MTIFDLIYYNLAYLTTFSIEMLLNPGYATKSNIVVFVSELFWKFEVRVNKTQIE